MSFQALKAARPTKSYVHRPSIDSQVSSAMPRNVIDGLYSELLPAMLEICKSQFSGRGIRAKQAVQPGTIILSAHPHTRVLSTPHLASCCSNCAAESVSDLKRCTGCRVVWYCDNKCQSDEWPLHKHECRALVHWGGLAHSASQNSNDQVAIPSDAIRCLARMVWARKLHGLDSVSTREVDSMQSHPSPLSQNQTEAQTHLAYALTRYMQISSPEELEKVGVQGIKGLVNIISKFTVNSHTLSAPTLSPIGVALSPTLALLNHSCVPNAAVVFPNLGQREERPMKLVALQKIEPGTEILVSYVDTTLPRPARLAALQDTYGFTCACAECSMPTTTAPQSSVSPPRDPREAMWCPKQCGGGICPLPTADGSMVRCAKCSAIVSPTDAESVLDAVSVATEALEKGTRLQFTEPDKAYKLCMNALALLTSQGAGRRLLLPTSHPVLALTRLAISLGIYRLSHIHHYFTAGRPNDTSNAPSGTGDSDAFTAAITPELAQETLDKTIRLAKTTVDALEKLLAKGHPMRGIALAELGRLYAQDEFFVPSSPDAVQARGETPNNLPHGPARLKAAYMTLLRAREELLIGFGMEDAGGEVGRDVREVIVRLESEMDTWREGMRRAREELSLSRLG